MNNTSRSVFKGCVFLAAVMGIGVSLYAEANINCNFESGTVEKWQKNSAETELVVTGDSLSGSCGKYALLSSGTEKNVGINYYSEIPVTARTVIEFDIRCDAQMPLAYFAFTATDNKKRGFWLFADTQNAVKNPRRGEWFHVIVPATALKTDKGQQPEPGDVFTSFGMFQVQVNGCPHRFVKNNIRDYKTLLTRTLEGKHAYVTGDRLYEFLTYCKTQMPERSAYNIIGMDEGALESRRAVYYLYPNVSSTDPNFIIDISQYTIKSVKE